MLPRSRAASAAAAGREPIIDVHQHVQYSGRADDVLIAHQRTLGVTTSVLMPSGDRGGGHAGGSGEHESVVALGRAHPGEFVFFANEITDHPDATRNIERQLRKGAIGIGEQKFRVECDSPALWRIAEIAREFDVPVLMHFQEGVYNRNLERFHRTLEKFPTVKFIGHAQAWWAHIDKAYTPGSSYPKGLVTPGGLTDRYLSDYPNCYADISAGSGNNAIVRDENHYRGFMQRHADKLLYGSDCSEGTGRAPLCFAARTLEAIRRLAPSREIERKILHENAKRLLKL
ncbi:MAG: amidohydrolase family protein [Opitutaceae bacterium]|nr:amidohydrolase family protein [Opitutaceae bacterium]